MKKKKEEEIKPFLIDGNIESFWYKNYVWKPDIIQKIFVNITDSSCKQYPNTLAQKIIYEDLSIFLVQFLGPKMCWYFQAKMWAISCDQYI